jgi:hypothetical protein
VRWGLGSIDLVRRQGGGMIDGSEVEEEKGKRKVGFCDIFSDLVSGI